MTGYLKRIRTMLSPPLAVIALAGIGTISAEQKDWQEHLKTDPILQAMTDWATNGDPERQR